MSTHLVVARELREVRPCPVEGITIIPVKCEAYPPFHGLVQVCLEQGVDEAWCLEQIKGGAKGVLAVDASGEPAGVGFVIRSRFWVDEIRHEFDPGAEGCYLYATYVRPGFRGRRIQQALDAWRMVIMRDEGAKWAYAVVEESNHASMKGHRRSGFETVARVRLWKWRGRTISRTRIVANRGNARLIGHGPGIAGWRLLRVPPQ